MALPRFPDPRTVFSLLRRIGLDGFILSLLGAVAAASFFPELLRTHGLIRLDAFTTWGVSIVFLLYGLTVSPQRMREGLVNWRLHLLTQSSTFLLFPALGLLGLWAGGRWLDPALALGLFYLCALPSTVSSSVAMTSIALGNVPGAIFNASVSSMLGVFITPLWVGAFLHTQGTNMPLGPVILKVVLLVLVPIIVGQLLRPFVLRWIEQHRTAARLLDRATIVAMVANAFADSVSEGLWVQHGLSTLLLIAALSMLTFWLVFAIMSLLSRALGFSREDRIAAIFCGSKKSLAAGVPMAGVMFAGNPGLGLIIAPIMIFHLLQLIAVSFVARRWREQVQPG